MNKNNLLIALFLLFSSIAFCQNNVGINTTTPNANAALDIRPVGKQGIQIPRLSASDTLSAPLSASSLTKNDIGLMFYDTTSNRFLYFNGSRWLFLSAGNSAISFNSTWQRKDSIVTTLHANDKVGISSSNITPQRVSLAVGGGYAIEPVTDVFVLGNLQVGNRSYIRVGGVIVSAINSFSNGVHPGQMLVLEALGEVKIDGDNGNLITRGDYDMRVTDTITFIWNGSRWVETCRSNN